MTPPRQVWLFQFGCWTALAAAGLHLAAFFAAPPALPPDVAGALAQVPAPHVFHVPGQLQPSFIDAVAGYSLALPALLSAIGLAGLSVARHGGSNARLLRGAAGGFAVGTGVLLVLSVPMFFGAGSFLLGVVALCFGMAAVPET